jgi:hypothetical protein
MRTRYETAHAIVRSIVNDLEDRKGLHNEWDMIDPEIRHEIWQEWVQLVLKELETDMLDVRPLMDAGV